jgi:hypothetical protein
MAGTYPLAHKIKVFCFFSSEKKSFLAFPLARLGTKLG